MMLRSSRISLYPLSLEELEKINQEKFNISDLVFSDFELDKNQKRAMNIKIEKMKDLEVDKPCWYTYWLILENESSKAVGTIGFKGLATDGSVEVGYGISKKFEGMGLMSESLGLLKEWAFSMNECKLITAKNVLKSNFGSQKVLKKNGFEEVFVHDNGIDYEIHSTKICK